MVRQPAKRHEHPFQFLRWDTGSVVGDRNDALFVTDRAADLDAPFSLVDELDCVGASHNRAGSPITDGNPSATVKRMVFWSNKGRIRSTASAIACSLDTSLSACSVCSDMVELNSSSMVPAHAESAIACRLDQACRLVRHLAAKLVQRLVAEVGHRRQRGLQIMRR